MINFNETRPSKKAFSLIEVAALMHLRNVENKTVKQIAEQLGRTQASVAVKLRSITKKGLTALSLYQDTRLNKENLATPSDETQVWKEVAKFLSK